jgi:Predicted methyltransferase
MRPIIDNNSQTIHISMLGREWLIERPASLEELWNRLAEAPPGTEPEEPGRNGLAGIDMNTLARAFEEDDRIPYWAEIWPSGIALGEWLHQQKKRVNGRLCLEMGCGLGLSAAAGAMAGGCVLGMDYEPIALYYAYRNSRKNLQPGGPGSVHFAAADWRRPHSKKARSN